MAKCETEYVAASALANTKMATYMMEHGTATNDLDKVSKSTETAPNTKANGKMTSKMATGF